MCGSSSATWGAKEAENPPVGRIAAGLEYRAMTAPAWPRARRRACIAEPRGRLQDTVISYLPQKSPLPGAPHRHKRLGDTWPASEAAAQPHHRRKGLVAVVHNGVIGEYSSLKKTLQSDGSS